MYRLEEAKVLIANKQYEQAITILNQLLSEYPENLHAKFELAKSYFMLKDFIKSENLFKETIKDNNLLVYSSNFLAKIYINEKKYLKALKLLLNLKDKNDKENLKLLFYLFEVNDDIDNMFKIYNKLISINDKEKDIKFRMFSAFKKRNYIEQSIVIAEDLIQDENISLRRKNSILNFIEYATKKSVLKSFPQNMIVALTNNCNLDCIMCQSKIEKKWNLSEELKQEIINLMPYLQNIIWLGGEPLLYKDLNLLLDLAQKNGVKQNIVTNGLLLNRQIIEKILNYNIVLQISVDAPNKCLYEQIRRGGNFDKLIENLNMLKSVIINSKRQYHLTLNCVILENNYKYLQDIVEFAGKFKFNNVSFLIHNQTNKYSKEILNFIKENLNNYYDIAKKYNITINSPLFDLIARQHKLKEADNKNFSKDIRCNIPWMGFTITTSGMVIADCICNVKSDGLLKGKKILEVWNDDNFVKIRKELSNNFMNSCRKECLDNLYSNDYRFYKDINIS